MGFVMTLVMTSCSNSSQEQSNQQEFEAFPYQIEAGLLAENPLVIPEIQAEYQIPVNYATIDQEYIDNIANEEQKNNPFNRKLLRIYLNQYINSTIAMYDMRHIPQEKINNEITNYQTTYNADGSWENISLKKYTSNHYPKIYWFEMKNQNITNIRIIFANNEKAQFCIDYNFASAYYEDLIPLIRSAAASVKPNLEPQITILWKKPIGTYITGS